MGKHIEHNGSGYADPTADAVIKREYAREDKAKEDERYRIMVKGIKRLLENNDYMLQGPISLINMESGRKRRIY
jgi:hypothetical protein